MLQRTVHASMPSGLSQNTAALPFSLLQIRPARRSAHRFPILARCQCLATTLQHHVFGFVSNFVQHAKPSQLALSLNVKTSNEIYAPMLSAVKTDTTFPDVLNFFRCSPSSPISEKNCLFPCCLLNKEMPRMPAPYNANKAPMA